MKPIDMLLLGGASATPYIEQNEASECGLACLAMVAGHHGYKTDLTALRRRFSMSLKGATLTQVIKIAENIGFNAQALRGDIDDLRHLSLPAILHWDLNHFVVITGISKGINGERYQINDPARGVRKLTREELSRHWTGVALDLLKSESFKPKIEQTRLKITQLWTAMNGFWSTFRSIIFLSLILQIAALAAPFYLQISIDTVLPSFDADLLFVLALGFGGLAVINMLTNWLRSYILVNLNSALSFQIIVNLYRHLVRLPLPWFEKRHVGDIISRFGSTQPITQLLGNGLITAIIDGLMAMLTLALMFVYSTLLGSVALVALLIYLAIRLLFLEAIKLRNVDVITTAAKENSSFIESMRGIAAIKAFGQEGNRQRQWQRSKADAINAEIRLGRLSISFDAISQFIIAIERVIFIYIAISLSFEGAFTVGMIFAFQAYKQQFLDASVRLVEQAINWKIIQVHLNRISDIALAKLEDREEQSPEAPDFDHLLSVRNLWYRYGAGEPEVLKGVNLTITPGEMIAITGPSGGGKTTLIKLMMGLFSPINGEIMLGQKRLSAISKQAFRSGIGVVAQGDSLFAGTLADNIAFFDPELDMERVREVARLAFVAEEIEAMPLAYDTLVGDMGSVLSGGQMQRVLLARALYNRPKILFMDEGTANLDAENEAKILETLRSLDCTRILTAHRAKTLELADSVFEVREGKLLPVRQANAKQFKSVNPLTLSIAPIV